MISKCDSSFIGEAGEGVVQFRAYCTSWFVTLTCEVCDEIVSDGLMFVSMRCPHL